MGYGGHCISSPRYCFSTQDYKEWMNKHYPNNDDDNDDEKLVPNQFYLNLPFCDDCEKYIQFVDNKCSNYRSHRLLVTCNYRQKDFRTFNNRHISCSSCCRLLEQKLKIYTFEKLKKLANVYNIKRRKQEYIIDDLVQKVEKYFFIVRKHLTNIVRWVSF